MKVLHDERVDDESRQRASGQEETWVRVGKNIKNKHSKSMGVVIDILAKQGKVRFRLDSRGYVYLLRLDKFIRLYEEA